MSKWTEREGASKQASKQEEQSIFLQHQAVVNLEIHIPSLSLSEHQSPSWHIVSHHSEYPRLPNKPPVLKEMVHSKR
jgi:hypothetical protein